MTISFRPAKLDKTPLLIGLAGPSGAGKTFSALRLAKGIAGGGKVFMIDTEARRGLHYAKMFDFQHGEMNAPFTPQAYMEAIQGAAKAGATVCIVDSTSHAHEGSGGILEQHETELTRMAGDDYRKREQMKFAAWIGPKKDHNRFVNTILQVQMHMIFCFRAKDKLDLRKVDGKLKPVQAGWTPICTDRFEYEQTMLLVLPPGAKGVPDLNEPATKIQEQHKSIVTPGNQLTEEMGAKLAAWASGDAINPPKAADPVFSWIGENGAMKNFKTVDEWAKFIMKGVVNSTDKHLLNEAINRNSPCLQQVLDAGFKIHVDEINVCYENKMRDLQSNPLGGG